ncbi:MAG: bifunctional hydroxymethylpyrimidine kinase/phosphomethylpyrimidine kinase, partial [Thermoplasmata archaeon]|nr:bifunctional hydroxymethylpyrimidine kinase/phosphomethylpyrimidine kinase [Thermoplasmata archaeon]
MAKRIPTVMTAGGSDSSGGAGIQEDLKVFAALDVHGCSVVTCVTAQNTLGVYSIHPVPPAEVKKQLDALSSDIELNAVKTGMLYSAGIVRVVALHLKKMDCPIVVDPVLTASVGKKLYTRDYLEAFKKHIVPLATVITPNIDEASRLSGMKIATLDHSKRSAEVIAGMGAENVVLKGFPSGREVVDVLFDGRSFVKFQGVRFDKTVHGSGCAFASAISAFLGKGLRLRNAVKKSRELVARGYMFSYKVGSGLEMINTHYKVDRYAVL